MERIGEPWQGGEDLSIAIGQGYNLVTPLQMAVLTAAVGNGGTLYKPKVLKKIENADGEVVRMPEAEINGGLPAGRETLTLVREGLVEVVQGERGTARRIRMDQIEMAGKTGTAQVVSMKEGDDLKDEPVAYKLRDHAWFVCYAPAVDPAIAVSVLIEHGGHGSSSAAPVAAAIVRKYLEKKEPTTTRKAGDMEFRP